MKILNEYVENGIRITTFTKDGTTVSHTIKVQIPSESEEQPTIEQQILAELQYNTALTEMKMLGGM